MKSAIAALLLAGVVSSAPHIDGHKAHKRLAYSGPKPFQPHSYNARHCNDTTPLAGSSAAAGTGGDATPSPSASPGKPRSSVASSSFSTSIANTTPKPSRTSSAESSSTASAGKVQSAGINIAGCDFGCDTSGNCNGNSVCPTTVGPTQMQHFSSKDGLNIFRLPVGWQYLVANKLGGPLDQTFFKTYDGIVQSCLKTNAKCIIDIHNYARWNGQVIGQSGSSVTNDNLANVWTQIAQKYATEANIVFGIMNEPHDLDINQWATTVQDVVTAIRKAGATKQWILLPGTGYTSAGGFESSSAPALSKVTNPDGSTTNLIYDVHRYYDTDSSGTHTDCVQDHVSDSFRPLGDYLRQNKRQAFLSETGGGNTPTCEQNVCSALGFLNSYSDVYLGWTGWGAGSFDASYEITETPNGDTDTSLVQKCIAGKFK